MDAKGRRTDAFPYTNPPGWVCPPFHELHASLRTKSKNKDAKDEVQVRRRALGRYIMETTNGWQSDGRLCMERDVSRLTNAAGYYVEEYVSEHAAPIGGTETGFSSPPPSHLAPR